jgi:1,4-alpha-glucan branching enzyme
MTRPRRQEQGENHARHFVSVLEGVFEQTSISEAKPVIVSPYDCELFGHWWHEGVAWIEQVYRLLAQKRSVDTMSLSEYVDHFGKASPP